MVQSSKIAAKMSTAGLEVEGEGVEVEWRDIGKLVNRATDFDSSTSPVPMGNFEPGPETMDFIQNECKVLVIGAGGLGCEILKDLALSGFRDIHVIDMDRIDLTNLNRQFLFRLDDVKKSKAEVAAAFINKRVKGVTVTPHMMKIQEKDEDFYNEFNIIIAGLDNVEARRWLNALLCNMVEVDEEGNVDPETVRPLIDGGTEGFKGQARVILPRITSCFECSLDTFPPQVTFPMCTIAETPRKPEHCIAYAMTLQWPQEHPDRQLNTDSPDDMQWVCAQAQERATAFGIEGVTYELTMGVVKNIIPAIASTNALVSAACVGEVLKLMTFGSQSLHTYMMYMGSAGAYTHTFEMEKKPNCVVCGSQREVYKMSRNTTLAQLRHRLANDEDLRLTSPSLKGAGRTLWMENPPSLRAKCEQLLEKPLYELLGGSGEVITITDPVYPMDMAVELTVVFEEEEAN